MSTFKEIWIDLAKEQKDMMAKALETSTPYLSQLAHGHRTPSKHFAKAIGMEVGISREQLFPGLFGTIASDQVVCCKTDQEIKGSSDIVQAKAS